MGIVTVVTKFAWVVLIRINGWHIGPVALGIWQVSVATQAEKSRECCRQLLDLFRVIYGGAVTVLALNNAMGGGEVLFDLLFVAFPTILLALVLDLEGLPVIDIAFAVETVGKILSIHPKVGGNHGRSDDQEKDDDHRNNEKWSIDMVLHGYPLFKIYKKIDKLNQL